MKMLCHPHIIRLYQVGSRAAWCVAPETHPWKERWAGGSCGFLCLCVRVFIDFSPFSAHVSSGCLPPRSAFPRSFKTWMPFLLRITQKDYSEDDENLFYLGQNPKTEWETQKEQENLRDEKLDMSMPLLKY